METLYIVLLVVAVVLATSISVGTTWHILKSKHEKDITALQAGFVSKISYFNDQMAVQEEHSKQQLMELEQSYLQELRTFHHTVSHATRMPVSIITGYAGLLRKGIADEAEKKMYLLKICEQAEDIDRLLTRSLQFEKSVKSIDDTVLEREDVNVGRLVGGMLEHMQYASSQLGVTVELIAPSEDITAPLDPILMKKVFYNLLENSLKYMKVTGEIRITLAKLDEGKCLIIWKDNGMGMDEEEVPHIFDLRFRGSGNEEVNGNGMGLSMVRYIVEQQSGTITAKSGKGKGMTFYIRFE
ncbi:MAG: HAMP domain-containing sensor histidine kinase [Eubacteriales bacterium]